MKQGIKQIHHYMTSLFKNVHGSALKSLSMIIWGFLLAKKPIIADITRKLNYKTEFESMYQRVWRFLNQSHFKVEQVCSDIAEHLLTRLQDKMVKRITIAIDWTKIGNMSVLFASIPIKGRAKPIFFKAWESWDVEGRMRGLELELVEQLLSVVPKHLRHKIVFVADRGFAKTELFKLIEDLGACFSIRLPRGIYVRIEQDWKLVEQIDVQEKEVKYYPNVLLTKENAFKINFVVTKLHEWEIKHKDDIVFFMATNLQDPKEVLSSYCKRPQIEAMFKDCKKRGLKIEQMLIETAKTARKMILVVMLYYIICILTAIEFANEQYVSRIQRKTNRAQLSLFSIGDNYLQEILFEPLSRDLINFIDSWFNK